MIHLICAIVCLVPIWACAQSPDLSREARLKAEIVDAILDGEPVDLPGLDGLEFLGIYTETEMNPARGAVLILHGRGFHPDWADVVQPLRVGLIEHGWNTMSIQLPVLEKDAKYNDYVPIFHVAIPRIERALADLRARGNERIVLVAHSCGFHMANHWLLQRDEDAKEVIGAFVGIGMGATDYGQPMIEPYVLDRLTVPVLDLFGAADFPAVLRMAPEREALLVKGGNPKSAQIVVDDADHYFRDQGDELVEVLAEWLARL